MSRLTPLEGWIREKTGIGPEPTGKRFAAALSDYQLQELNHVVTYARANSPFYRRRLESLGTAPFGSLSDVARLPFTTAADLVADPLRFLAVRQDDIARIVTLRTSGSTGESKRLFFTESDLELTIDFFHHGMSTLVGPGQKVAILLPGDKPDSVGDLLARGLARMDVESLRYGPVADPEDAASAIASFGAHCLVGIPTQVLSVALAKRGSAIGNDAIECVLLSTDYVPRSLAQTLENIWGCRVFNHYGMTEMGLGGGVECEALEGYHLREADLYFEVVDRTTGEPCPDGVEGEVVFTTLTRQGMPLIRYRTGDIGRFLPGPCPCGTALRRMDRVRGRWEGVVDLGSDRLLALSDVDEALFRLPGLVDYRLTLSRAKGAPRLHVDVCKADGAGPTEREVFEKLAEVAALRSSIAAGTLGPPTVRFSSDGSWTTTGVAKRRILVKGDLKTG